MVSYSYIKTISGRIFNQNIAVLRVCVVIVVLVVTVMSLWDTL